MKKLIYILIITIITLNSVYSATSNLLPYSTDIQLQSQIDSIPYQLKVSYEGHALKDSQNFIIKGLSLAHDGETGLFVIYLSNGNQNKTITYKAKITPSEFFRTTNEFKIVNTNVFPYIINKDNNNEQYIYETKRAPGFKTATEIGRFVIRWKGDSNLKSGFYTSVNTINISID